ncbi:hypothetical protein [Holdemanella biformis]
MVTEAKIKANNASNKRNTTTVLLRLNYNTDADILEKLGQVNSKMGYIKTLIREDLKKEKRKARRQQ